jgi:hypothetical protein
MRRPSTAFAVAVLIAFVAGACSGGSTNQSAPSGDDPAVGSGGTIAFVDKNGCISRVSGATGATVAAPFCTTSRAGVTALTWIDGRRLAFTTAEARALGWQLVDFDTGRVEVMPMQEAPRVFLIPPQYWSPMGEQLEVDASGVATVEADTGPVRVFPPPESKPDPATRLVAWSPDAGALILSVTTGKDLWVVGRDGANPRRIAEATRGVASWWMPRVGATPHADLTCSVIVEGSYACLPGVRSPVVGSGEVAFSWSPCPGATGYEFEVLDASGATIFATVTAGQFLHVPFSALPSGASTWRMRSLIGPSPAPWTTPASFPAG